MFVVGKLRQGSVALSVALLCCARGSFLFALIRVRNRTVLEVTRWGRPVWHGKCPLGRVAGDWRRVLGYLKPFSWS